MTTKVTAEPSAIDLAAAEDAKIAHATEQSKKVTRAEAEGKAELADAVAQVDQALEAVMRGDDPGAEAAHEAALTRRYAATEQLVRLDAEQAQAAALREIARAKARKGQLFDGCLSEFAEQAEQVVAKCTEAAQRLADPLREYLASYAEAVAVWQPLLPAVRSKLEADEAQSGFYRSGDSVIRDTSCPACPLDASVLSRVASVQPRPPSMDPAGFDGNPFRSAPSEGDTAPEMIDGHGNKITFDGSGSDQ